jgi:uncharacterized protein DUF3489
MTTIESENSGTQEPETAQPRARRKPTKKSKAPKTVPRAKKATAKAKADGSNKKAEAIAPMKRAKTATLAEIMKATVWQPHTVRGFVSILGRKGGEKIESYMSAGGERMYKIAEVN